MPLLHAMRPRLHLVARSNWLNDPNGLFYVGPELHVTYQLNPDAPEWGRMHWGHAASADLVSWRHLPIALSPDVDGVDDFGCWSGGVIETDGEAHLFYTGVHLDDGVRLQSVCHAVSTESDRLTWAKDPGNPVIAGAPAGIALDLFRDPFVFRDGAGWRMLVGAGTEDGRGAVLQYRSGDLRTWQPDGTILSSDQLDPTADGEAPMWECPQLLRFGDRDVLIVSVVDRAPGIRPSHVLAAVGRLEERRFAVQRAGQLGMGPDFYAPACVRTPDGRWLLFGWIPEDPPGADPDRTWAGALSLPRRVTMLPDDRVSLAFAEEVAAIRRAKIRYGPAELMADGPALQLPLRETFEVEAVIAPGEGSEVALDFVDEAPTDPLARVAYRAADRVLSVARRGIVTVAGRSSMSTVAMPASDGATVRLRIVVDASILEVEANGHVMATVRLASSVSAIRTLAVTSSGGGPARILALDVWSLDDGPLPPAGPGT